MKPLYSFFSYTLLFSIYLFLLCRLFRPHKPIAFYIQAALEVICAAAIQTVLEYYILSRFPYHAIALSLLVLYLITGFLLIRKYFLFQLYYALFISVLSPCLTFLVTNILSLGGFLRLDFLRFFLPNLLLFLTCLWIIRFSRNYSFSFPLPLGYWVTIFAASLLEYYCLIKINDLLTFNQLVTSSALMVQFFYFLIVLLVYCLILNMCQNYQDTLTEQATVQQLSLREAAYNENQEIFEQMRVLRHELKNHMFYMDYLIDQKRYDELHEYFMDFYQKEYGNYGYWDTGSSPVSTLLNQRQLAAEKKQIQMTIDSSLPEKTGIRDVDLCTILTNLLDNAMESCETQTNACILVELSQKKDYLSLIIKNTIPDDVLARNPSLLTTKPNRRLHGIGLAVVRRLVQKYDGISQFFVKDNFFVVKILLKCMPLEKEEMDNAEHCSL